MTRSRLAVLVSSIVVVLGLAAGLGALWLNQARRGRRPDAGGGARPARRRPLRDGLRREALHREPVLRPLRLRARHAAGGAARARGEDRPQPRARRRPDRGGGLAAPRAKRAPGLAMVFGRFDLYKLGRAMETEGKAVGHNVDGVSVYGFKEEDARSLALAFLDESSPALRPADRRSRRRWRAARGARRRSGRTPSSSGSSRRCGPGPRSGWSGDQSLLAGMPTSVPAPRAPRGTARPCSLPALKSLTVTGDLDPQVSLSVTGEAADEARRRTWPTSCAASSR